MKKLHGITYKLFIGTFVLTIIIIIVIISTLI